MIKKLEYSFADLGLTAESIETVLGYKQGEDTILVTELIEQVFAEAENITTIKAQYEIFNEVHFDQAEKSLSINGINFGISKIIFTQIKKSDSVAIFLSTAGPEIGIRSRKAMQERDFLKGYIYDVVGSEIVEAAADLMQADLEKSVIESDIKITNRYSPGYCGWNVAEQHNLFSLLHENFCGIQLTDSALMDPVKSASGIIGIGKNVRFNPYTCRMCSQEDCVYRRLKEKSTGKPSEKIR